ncbi:MAG: TetR/AcrR family transcriptional regulator [Rhizobiaceae bacterium]|nr:TetR/AcrR family transcriptional regulator [Rhizobiaceae bacterium]
MARTRTFDETEVLVNAMHAFRRHGYAGASVKHLEEATGLTSGSLYNAFGDKQGLYHAAARFYVDAFIRDRVSTYAGKTATLDDLQGLFLSLLKPPMTDGFGCLITNALVEFGTEGPPGTDFVRRGLGLVSAGIRGVLEREIGADAAETATTHLLVLYQGMLVLSRAGWADARLEAMVTREFDLLRARRDGAT